MSQSRYSAYRIMWLLVLFDLPTETKTDRKRASKFRKQLLEDGFEMLQFSVYLRHCGSRENAEIHIKRVREILPLYGKVDMLRITDKQFGRMERFYGRKSIPEPKPGLQIELF